MQGVGNRAASAALTVRRTRDITNACTWMNSMLGRVKSTMRAACKVAHLAAAAICRHRINACNGRAVHAQRAPTHPAKAGRVVDTCTHLHPSQQSPSRATHTKLDYIHPQHADAKRTEPGTEHNQTNTDTATTKAPAVLNRASTVDSRKCQHTTQAKLPTQCGQDADGARRSSG